MALSRLFLLWAGGHFKGFQNHWFRKVCKIIGLQTISNRNRENWKTWFSKPTVYKIMSLQRLWFAQSMVCKINCLHNHGLAKPMVYKTLFLNNFGAKKNVVWKDNSARLRDIRPGMPMSDYVMSYHIMSPRIISCHIMPYKIITYHITSYQIIFPPPPPPPFDPLRAPALYSLCIFPFLCCHRLSPPVNLFHCWVVFFVFTISNYGRSTKKIRANVS